MSNPYQSGVTLIELLVTLSILAVLLGVAAPGFSDAMQNARVSSAYNALVGSLRLARSEAVKSSDSVAVCARRSDTKCGLDWNNGWLVFTDQGATPGAFDADETMLRVVAPPPPGVAVTGIGKVARGSGMPTYRTHVRFLPRGNSHWRGGGLFRVCDQRGTDSLRAATLNMNGAIARARANQNGDYVDAWGRTIACNKSKT